jgi:hypothetical protein
LRAGVVEHVERQRDDGFEPVVFDDPAADVAFALTGVAGKQRGAVVDLCNAAAERCAVLPFGQHVREEHHLPIAGSGDQAVLRVASVFDDEARVADACLAAHALLIALPALAVGRVRQHEIELA